MWHDVEFSTVMRSEAALVFMVSDPLSEEKPWSRTLPFVCACACEVKYDMRSETFDHCNVGPGDISTNNRYRDVTIVSPGNRIS